MSVRITQGMLSRSVLSDIQDVSARLEQTRRKLASGKALERPSDDPFGVSRSLTFRDELAANRQYQRSIDEAHGWQSVADTALQSVGDSVLRARELAVQAANGSASAGDRATIAAEVEQLLASTKSDANVQYAGRFVFSGSATLTRPYTTADDAYHGDAAAVYREIGPGVQIAVNTPGSAVIGDGSSGVIQALRGLLTHLQTNDVAGIGSDIGTLDAAHAAVVSARADIGARSNRLDAASARLSQLEETTSSLLSKIEDADMAKTLIDASTQQSVYESALRAGARIVQTSLLDFLQ